MYWQHHSQLGLKRTATTQIKQAFGHPHFHRKKVGWENSTSANTDYLCLFTEKDESKGETKYSEDEANSHRDVFPDLESQFYKRATYVLMYFRIAMDQQPLCASFISPKLLNRGVYSSCPMPDPLLYVVYIGELSWHIQRERGAILKKLCKGNHIWGASSRPALDLDDKILTLSWCFNGMKLLGTVVGEGKEGLYFEIRRTVSYWGPKGKLC